MSADNGVYILKTKGENGGYEYRVRHAQAIENIQWYDMAAARYTRSPYPKAIRDYFGGCKVFTDHVAAIMEAREIEQDYLFTEYGICTISLWDDKTFKEITNVG
jgi:hypothetical protein